MALTWTALAASIAVLFMFVTPGTEGLCRFPSYVQGDWFYIMSDQSLRMIVDNTRWGHLECDQMHTHNKPVPGTMGSNHTFLLTRNEGCNYCLDVLWRTANVLQVRQGKCEASKTNVTDCDGVRRIPGVDLVMTFFKVTDEVNVNCISTFEGVYQYTYEVDQGGGGICNNPDSQIKACLDPGSAYIDNQVFRMQFAKCPNVETSYNKQIRYQCYGTWFAMRGNVGYTYAAILDIDENDITERFKCLMTNKNQKDAQNKIRWVMSRFANCDNLNSIWDGPVRLVLTRIGACVPDWVG